MAENMNLESKERLFKEFSHFLSARRTPPRFSRTGKEESMLGEFPLHTMRNAA